MRWNTSSKIHWKRKVIMDEKRRQCCMSDGRGCAHQLRLMTRREKLKLSLLLFWIHYSRRKWHAAIIDFLVYLNKVLLMKSRSQAAHLRTICLTIRRESLCVLSLSLLIAACGLFKDSPALNPWEDKLNWNNKPLCSNSPIFEEMYYYIYYHHTLDFLIIVKWDVLAQVHRFMLFQSHLNTKGDVRQNDSLSHHILSSYGKKKKRWRWDILPGPRKNKSYIFGTTSGRVNDEINLDVSSSTASLTIVKDKSVDVMSGLRITLYL